MFFDKYAAWPKYPNSRLGYMMHVKATLIEFREKWPKSAYIASEPASKQT